MRTAQRVLTAFVVVLAMVGLGTTAAHAGSTKALAMAHHGSAKDLAGWQMPDQAEPSGIADLWWDRCETAGQEVIFLEKYRSNCGSGSSNGDV